MHLQYYLNLGLVNKYKYTGSGKIQLIGSASANFTENKYSTFLKFKPYDVGFDINANQWKILEIFGVNGKFVYKACNGSNSKIFNEEDLFTETQIVQVYNDKVDYEINCLLQKYQTILNS